VTVNFWAGDAIMATDSHYVELIPRESLHSPVSKYSLMRPYLASRRLSRVRDNLPVLCAS
jgi:hypothetical protein